MGLPTSWTTCEPSSSSPHPGLCPLASSESDSLAILLQLGNQLITLAYNVLVLLVLVVGPVGLDDALA